MESPTIHERIIAIIDALPAIGRNQRNIQQNFNFRGIDDVLNALKPLLATHGVHYAPTVLERIYEPRQTGGGKIMHTVHLHVSWTFYGAQGDSITCATWGEGTDMGDKATNKALTASQKYALFNVFSIASEDQASTDSDGHAAEETQGPTLSQRAYRAALRITANKDDALAYMSELKLKATQGEERELTEDETLALTLQLESEMNAMESA